MKEKQKRTSNKGLWIAGGICAAVCVLLVAALALAAPVSAWIRRSETLKALEAQDEVKVILTDPKQDGAELFSTAEIVLSDGEASAARALLFDSLKNSEFDETRDAPAGVWYLSATVSFHGEGGAQSVRLYLGEEHIYIAHGERLTSYEVDDPMEESYEEFYRDVKKRLSDLG